jgi:hypothetical protein
MFYIVRQFPHKYPQGIYIYTSGMVEESDFWDSNGQSVAWFNSGREAVSKLKREVEGLIKCDIGLHGETVGKDIGGYEENLFIFKDKK